ncbi:TPA: capsular biosynthesis protein [Clostridium botulinum]|uniref:YveK family protein n=1 Tax=Clostridium TaxID=1485 RepID=UPI000774D492|nr:MULTISPECIES: Wzz/FepE/Etk N-terminal domain-containing protein [Clostridium]AUM96485.1 capsular biosynthesis protein [Clostridium sporogenes]AVQ53937.1 capsular biosynthesis protein [Clostridium botulinum]NFP91593.1 capsular biosynthesis protein [Clostridium sporogenes]HBJ2615549.1 capsular biosynthesis protein [Clostridium botulinum]
MNEEVTLDLREIFNVLKKKRKMILITTLLFGIVSAALSFFIIAPTYEVKASVVIGKSAEEKNENKNNYNDVMMYQKLVKTYAQIASSRTVAENVVSKTGQLKPEELQKKLNITPQQDTQIIDLKIEDKDAEFAHKVLTTACNEFIAQSKKIYPNNTIELLDKPVIPEKPIKPKKILNITIALFLGLLISIGIAFVQEYMDKTIKTENDIDRYLDLPVIAVIPKIK